MKVSLSWIREFVDATLGSDAVAHRLTMAGIEVETVQALGALSPSVVVASLVDKAPLGHARRTGRPGHVLHFDVGRILTVVSFAPAMDTAEPGALVPVALPGAWLFDPTSTEAALKRVEPTDVHGTVSEGVLCSAAELGIGQDHSDVLLLSGDDKERASKATAGAPLREVLIPSAQWTADVVLEVAILANIARCQSVVGVAREVAALVGAPFIDRRASEPLAALSGPLAPQIDAPLACRRLTLTLMEGIRVVASPDWIQRRLSLAGIVPVNNVVDASNYVMLEMGQPTHAYAADSLPDVSLRVRLSVPGEVFRPLAQVPAGESIVLPEGVPVVVSAGKPVALAGVIGSHDTRVTSETRRIVVEAASFDMLATRRSQARTRIYTEASARFSRGVDPTSPKSAVERMVSLLRLTCPELRVEHFAETVVSDPAREARCVIDLTVAEVNAALGTQLSVEEVLDPLQRLGFACEHHEDQGREVIAVTVPDGRRDIAEACDLIEEVVRIRGFDELPATMPVDPVPQHPYDTSWHARERARDALVEAGLQEVISYTFTSPGAMEALARASDEAAGPVLQLRNPVSIERSVVRRSLIAGLLQIYCDNGRRRRNQGLFEIGTVVLPERRSPDPRLPLEQTRAGIVIGGLSREETAHEPAPRPVDFFDLKAVVAGLLERMHVDGVTFEAAHAAPFTPGACARVSARDTTYGYLGLVHPLVAEAFDLTRELVFCADLDLDALVADARRVTAYRGIPRFPSIDIDIAIIADSALPAQRLVDVARAAGEPLVRRVTIFDVFEGVQLGRNQRGIGLRLSMSAETRTLQMAEAQAVRDQVVGALRASLNVRVRE